MKRCPWILGLVTMVGFPGVAWADWNAATDFSSASNPAGSWSYGSRADLNDTALAVYSSFTTSLVFSQSGPLSIWYLPDVSPFGVPFVLKNESGADVTIDSSPPVVVPVGRLMVHPGPSAAGEGVDSFTVVRWTAPVAGTFQVSATFYGMDIGDTDVHVVVNGTSVFDDVRSGVGDNRSFNGSVTVSAGDTIDFVVGRNGDESFDSTGLDASIAEPQFDFAFADFSDVSCLTLNGDAAQVGAILRLAPSLEGQAGSAWYTCTKAHVADGFDTTFVYQMWNSPDFPDGADGLAFLIQDESTAALGAGGSGMGFEGITRSLAVEFDTFGILPETDNHIAVQTLGASANSADDLFALGLVNPATDLNDGNPHTVRVSYLPGTLKVFLDDMFTPVLVVAVDLQNISGDDILDGSGDAWVGFTAGTGLLMQDHDILSWSFSSTIAPPTGACCTNAGCIETTAQDCSNQNGYFQGAGVSCSDPNLDCANLGRCCFTDGTCATTSIDFCFNVLSGPLFSTPGTCDDFPCPAYGACCSPIGGCSVGWDFECNGPGQTFLGAATTCTPDPCTDVCACRGDMTGDLVVNGEDVQRFVACFLAAGGGAPTSTCGCSDVNHDGFVNPADLDALVTGMIQGSGCQ